MFGEPGTGCCIIGEDGAFAAGGLPIIGGCGGAPITG